MSGRALGTVVVSLVILVATGTRADAQAQPGRLRPPSDFAGIGNDEERSRALFREAGKVLQHPRCVNCHPDGDRPLQGNGYPHQPPVQRGADDKGLGVTTMRCTTCHGKANFDPGRVPGDPEWSLAKKTMAWQGKSLGQICAQVKDPELNNGRSLDKVVHHMQHHGLVGWAWNPGAGREKAPGTWKEFGALISAWAESGAHCPPP